MDTLPSPLWTNDTSERRITGTWRSALPEYSTSPSPCLGACPVHGRIAEWIQSVKNGEDHAAWTTLVNNNPFPSIAGRICHHPCETACNRVQLDETVGICSLERYVGDKALNEGWAFPAPAEERSETVAVVGGGPAGLSAAYQMRRRGFRVTLIEQKDQLGGLLRYGIPSYRLDKSILDGEIQRIVDLGVDIQLSTEVGDDAALQKLRDDFDAVYLATGASRSKTLPNLDYSQPWVIDSADFLATTNAGEPCDLGQRLVIIGGGSAAMDVARTARRLGRSVTVLSLEPEALLPAQRIEVDEAMEEAIEFESAAMMQSIDATDAGLTLNCIRIDFKPCAERGAFTFEPIAGSEFQISADAIIPSIGQDADLARWSALLDSKGPVVDIDNQWQTSADGVFAGGDLACMERFVTQAVGMGKDAAVEIARYITASTDTPATELAEIPYSSINTSYYPQAPRNMPAHAEVAERLQSFQEVQQPLSHAEALSESARCFSCGTCIYCDNCYFYCPDMAIIKLERGYEVKTDYCKGCGLCVEECPTASLAMREDIEDEIR